MQQLAVEALSTEAVTTSEIEGEILDRASVQSSIRKQLGLSVEERRVRPAEQGIAEMMVDLYRSRTPLPSKNCSSALSRRAQFHLKFGQSSCCQFQVMSDSTYFYRSHYRMNVSYRGAFSALLTASSRVGLSLNLVKPC